MKLKEFLDNIHALVKEDPTILELDVITSKDAEGNGFDMVYYSPSIGVLEDDEFISANSEDFGTEHEYTREYINAICIN